MLRIYFSSLVKGRKMEKSSREDLLIVNSHFNAIHFRFSFLLFFSNISHFVSYSSTEIHSFTLIVSGSLNETGPCAAPVHPRETIVSTIVRSHDICVSHSVTNTDASLRINTRIKRACKLCS